MLLRIKPYHKSIYPLRGILIKSRLAEDWIKEMQWMDLSLTSITVFPIPDTVPNTIWGCLVIYKEGRKLKHIGKNIYCQLVKNKLFIPENAILYPTLSDGDVEKLFSSSQYIMHPEFGFFELSEPIIWENLITLQKPISIPLQEPETGIYVPGKINSFQVNPLSPEEILENLEQNMFPESKKFSDKPLSMIEKIKLYTLRGLFSKEMKTTEGRNEDKETSVLKGFAKINRLFPKKSNWINKLQLDLEELEKRNQKQIDKLMDLFKNNPKEALKYAIPLDENGTSRGGDHGFFDMSKRWFDFSLFSGNASGRNSGGTVVLQDQIMNQLRNQYNNTASELIKNKEYQKAAFVYMKLLKNFGLAAQTLENGKFYQEAASVYMKYLKNKNKAAECFEKGNMVLQAIEIYKELNENEKVGDLYISISQRDEAHQYYHKVIEDYKLTNQYVKASLIYRNKINNISSAQVLLKEGWLTNKDALNCLNNYFVNIPDVTRLEFEIESIYAKETNEHNKEIFLEVIKHEYNKHPELTNMIKEIAYEIIADRINVNPDITSELNNFNKSDKRLTKDIIKYRMNQRRKK